MKIATGVLHKMASSKCEFQENRLSDSRTLLKDSDESSSVLLSDLDYTRCMRFPSNVVK